MNVLFFKNHPAFSSQYVAIVHDFDDNFTNELNAIDSDNVLVIRNTAEAKAMLFFNREQDYNWYMLKWK